MKKKLIVAIVVLAALVLATGGWIVQPFTTSRD